MEKNSMELQRARRRHKALLREHASLDAASAPDPVVEEEICKLEVKYPELRLPRVPDHRSQSNYALPATLPREDAPGVEAGNKAIMAPGPCAADGMSSHTRLRRSAPPSLLRQAESPLEPRPQSSSLTAAPQTSCSISPPQPAATNYHMMMLALQLYNETHHKSLLTKTCLASIAALSMATALAHCTIVDPATFAGSLLSPSLLALLVHANFLCGLYLRRRRRFTGAMVVVYIALDVIPSLGLCVVCYNVGLIALELCGFRRASYAC